MKTVIEMAREAGLHCAVLLYIYGKESALCDSEIEELRRLERFAELVRADERNSWPAEMEAMERQVNILTDALAQEREACAKLADLVAQEIDDTNGTSSYIALTIRARGATHDL